MSIKEIEAKGFAVIPKIIRLKRHVTPHRDTSEFSSMELPGGLEWYLS
jgi:hypothetical protein